MKVVRTEKYIISSDHKNYKEIEEMSRRCRALHNSILYDLRTIYFNIEKDQPPKMKNYPHWSQFCGYYKNKEVYTNIGNAKVAQLVVKQAWTEFSNFSKAYWAFLKNPSSFTSKPKLPKYIDKNKGSLIPLNTQAISNKLYRDYGIIRPSQLSLELPFRHSGNKDVTLKQVNIVPRNGYFIVNAIYDLEVKKHQVGTESAAIDLGVNNLAAFVATNDISYLYDGSKIKHINHTYNHLIANAKSELPNGVYTSKKINRLWRRRDAKLKHELHKISRVIVENMKLNNIFELYVGKNDNWKQNVNLGKKNNREFVSIPFNSFIFMLKYKAEEFGISINEVGEAYTSKASSIDKDYLPATFGNYSFSGTRITRNLYESNDGTQCNADSNAAMNILRKSVVQVDSRLDYSTWSKGCVVSPVKVKVH